jgi:transcriptional regulator with GAF, ATPase, and Fis domain
MADDTETVDLPGEVRRSLSPLDAGLVRLAWEGAEPPKLVPIPLSPLFIGRAPPEGHVKIAESAVSKLHAELVQVDGGVRVRDLGSRNGVIVSGRRVDEAVLVDHDLLHLGNSLYLYVAQGLSRFTAAGAGTVSGMVIGPRLGALTSELLIVARADLSVLLLGQTGTGKEVFARALHHASGRRGRFVALNCAALPPALIEAELFGVKRGAFTGADRDREGLFRAADGGTLFLDEIGEMPLEAQAKLLRCLATKEVVSVGATTPVRSDVRFVCATHRDLSALSLEGRFRADLLGRIREHTCTLPPVRERREDILPLFSHFAASAGRPSLAPNFRAAVLMHLYDWPFNVREIESLARRAAVLVPDDVLRDVHLPPEIRALETGYGSRVEASPAQSGRPRAGPQPLGRGVPEGVSAPGSDSARMGAPPEAELRELLTTHQGNVAALARELGKDRTQLHRWFRRYGLDPKDYRGPV